MLAQLVDPSRYAFNALTLQSQIVAFAAFCLGVFMLGRELDRRLRTAFFLLTSSISIWLFAGSLMYASPDEVTALVWAKASYLGIAFIPAANYYFTTFILRDYDAVRSRVFAAWTISALFLGLILTSDLVFGGMYRYSWGWFPKYRVWGVLFSLYFIGMVSAVIFRLGAHVRGTKKDSVTENHTKGILVAYLVGGLACWDFLPLYGVELYPLGYVPILIFTLIAAYLITKRRFPEEISNLVLPRIIDTMQDALIVMDRDGIVRLLNRATCKLFARAEQELMGKRLAEVLTDTTQFATTLERAICNDRQEFYELEFNQTGGARLTLSISVSVIGSRTGEALFFVCVMHDITKRIETEQALKQSNAVLDRQLRFTQTLLKTEPVAVFFKDTEGRYLGCNEAFSGIVGVAPDAIKGKTVFNLWPADLAQKYHDQDMALLKNPGHQVYEYKVKNASGSMRDVIFTKDVFTDEHGTVQGIIGTFFDITERKLAETKIQDLNAELEQRVIKRTAQTELVIEQLEIVVEKLQIEVAEHRKAEEALRENKKRYRQLLDTVTDYIYTVTIRNGIAISTVHGPGCAAVTGYSTEDFAADPELWIRMVPEQDRDAVVNQADKIVLGEDIPPLEHRIVHRDGSVRWVRNTTVPQYDEQRQIIAYDGLISDITGRKLADEAMRESERKFRTLFEESFDGLFITSPGGSILDMNKKGIDMFGYTTKEEVQRLDLARDVYAEAETRSRILTMVNEHGHAEYEVMVRKKDGTKMTAYCSLSAVRDGAGAVIQYRGIIRDVTEQKRTREALQDAKRQLDYVLSTSPAVIYTCSCVGEWHATFVSENLVDVLGYTAQENLKTPGFWINRVHPEDRQRVVDDLQDLSDVDYYAHEYRFLHKDGRYLWMLDRFRVIRDARGIPVEFIGSWLDITERKQTEEDLKTNRIFLNNILNSIQDPIVVLDRNQNILMTNKTFEAAFAEVPPLEFPGKSCHEVLFGSGASCAICLAEQSNLTRKASHKVVSYPRASGGSKWYDVFAYPLFTTEGRVVGNVHHLRDITDQRNAEEKIVKDQEQLRSLTHQLLTSEERERQRISRELHDEMGQMLTGIKLNLQEVRQQANAEAAKKIGSIQQDIGDLMVRMRDLSSRLRPSLLDDLGLLPALQWHIERFSKQTGVRIEFEHEAIDRRLPRETALTMFRIVQESLTNAVRHSGAESVRITLMIGEGTIHAMVRDKGVGFDPEDALSRGTTLGLAGMRERVEMVGGSLSINSSQGEGTEIRCSIPIGEIERTTVPSP